MVERELATDLKPEEYVKLSREFSELTPVIDTIKAYRAVVHEITDLDAMIGDASTDGEMRRMAESEKPALQEKREALEKEWDRRHPEIAGNSHLRREFVRRSMIGFGRTLRARLVGLVLVLPLVAIVVIVILVNYD